MSGVPSRAQASTIVLASSADNAIGFSQRTAFPATAAFKVHFAMEAVGQWDINGIDVRVGKQRFVGRVYMVNANALRILLCAVGIAAGQCAETAVTGVQDRRG